MYHNSKENMSDKHELSEELSNEELEWLRRLAKERADSILPESEDTSAKK